MRVSARSVAARCSALRRRDSWRGEREGGVVVSVVVVLVPVLGLGLVEERWRMCVWVCWGTEGSGFGRRRVLRVPPVDEGATAGGEVGEREAWGCITVAVVVADERQTFFCF